jgi:hypothetical protein
MRSLLELREAAKALPFENPNRLALMHASDEVWTCVAKLLRDVTADNLTTLNGVWARAAKLLADATKPPTPPLSGSPEVDVNDLSDILGQPERKAA